MPLSRGCLLTSPRRAFLQGQIRARVAYFTLFHASSLRKQTLAFEKEDSPLKTGSGNFLELKCLHLKRDEVASRYPSDGRSALNMDASMCRRCTEDWPC